MGAAGYLALNGVALGLGAAAPIGPVNVEIARRVMRFGRGAGFLLGCGAVTVDVAYAVVSSVAMLPVMAYPRVMAGLSVAGGLFLAYLAWGCLRNAWGVHGGVEGTVGEREGPGREEERARDSTAGPGGTRWGHYASGC